MSTLLVIALALFAPISALAGSTVERELSFPWDSLRFALGVLESDSYGERPILVLYKTADGGVLMNYSTDTPTSRTLDKSQVTSLVARLTKFFTGAIEQPRSPIQRNAPAFDMLLSIDNGLLRRSFIKSLDTQRDLELIREYSKYLNDLSTDK